MTKGDSCDANPIHPLARIHTHASSSNLCALIVHFLLGPLLLHLLSLPLYQTESAFVVVLWRQGPNYSDLVLNQPLQNAI